MRQLLWLRTDLRTLDNTALNAALISGPTLAIFFISPEQWKRHHDSPSKVNFWLRNLESLRESLDTLNIPLLIRYANNWDCCPTTLQQICLEYSVSAVHVNTEYGEHENKRDKEACELLEQNGVAWHSHFDQLFFQPGSLLTQEGKYFRVFSQFRKKALQQWFQNLPQCLPAPSAQAPLEIASDPIPMEIDGYSQPPAFIQSLWPAGEAFAYERLTDFCAETLLDYQKKRDTPSLPGTSQLSPYLAAGVLSPRQCLNAALQENQGEFESGQEGVTTWINELLWREFYKHILVGFPHVSRNQPFRLETKRIAWRNAPTDLKAWQEGKTGFPIIDAAMRQLIATGWMHNRLRMIVSMFLSKNLLIDWRHGERFFMEHLIDGDLAANNGGWQWSASTGTDAVPYFRVFNPITQSKTHDPQGMFIRHWLPELAHLSDKEIHQPPLSGPNSVAAFYPAPIVDLKKSRERAITAFQALSTPQLAPPPEQHGLF